MRFRLIPAIVAALLLATSTLHAGEVSGVLGTLSWGDSPETLLESRRAMLMDEYRERVAGMTDPLEIDRVRRSLDERHEAISNSHERFEENLTGYEVSVLAGEIRGAAGYSLITARNRDNVEFFVFRNDRLVKIIQAFELGRLDFMGFEPFVDQLADVLGPIEDAEHQVDDIGRRMTIRAWWNDGTTRLRVENRSTMYNAYVLVFSDASIEDDFVRQELVTGPAARRSRSRVGSIMENIEERPASEANDPAVVDRIIGRGPSEVRTMLRADERDAAERAEREAERSAMEDEEELEEGERRTRTRSRTTPRQEQREEETFY